ncbi:MAG TPA: L,D-transpeptidase [Rhodospirillaceae bacterium]|jgi:L,D-transpeptidase ErfK/SrfK|nr:L,D-transpeptidase family protein [Alphaproteobacteria bacterium]HBH25858.1 L,D-transpeptidase [Rhodospirillaceae bacterium]
MRALLLVLFVLALPARAEEAKPYVGNMDVHIAQKGDSFAALARKHGLGFVEMRAANPGVDPWGPPPGATVTLPTRHLLPDAPRQGIVINLPEARLYSFGGQEPASYPIGIGREGLETPVGKTTVRAKVEAPTWRPTPRMRAEDPSLPEVVPPGPDNPMGSHALYLGWPQYAIHGTNKPLGVGRRVSSGCIRLDPHDIPRLFAVTPVGAPVRVVNQPVKAAWVDGTLYVEVSPTMAQSFEMEDEGRIAAPALSLQDWSHLNAVIGDKAAEVDWGRLRTALREARGYPTPVSVTATLEEGAPD